VEEGYSLNIRSDKIGERLDGTLTADEYFAMIILALMGLTFIAFLLIFLYMVYGEKEEKVPSTKMTFLKNILGTVLLCLLRITSL
jgi:hypothetical protein